MKPRLPPKFVPENRLEELLFAAGKNPEVRVDFYRELLSATVTTLGKPTSGFEVQEDPHQIGTGLKAEVMQVEYKGAPVIPLFTSMKRMTDVIPPEYYRDTGYMSVNCKTLLEALGPNRTYALNPGHMIVLTISPDQVSALLDGTIFKKLEDERKAARGLPTIHSFPHGTPVSVSRPHVLPSGLISSLADYFRSTGGDVEQAFVGQIHIPTSGLPPHLVVGLKLSAQSKRTFDQISVDLGPTIQSALGAKQVLDVVDMRRSVDLPLDKMVRIYPE